MLNMAGGSVNLVFGVLVVPLQEQMGWSPAGITLSYSLTAVTAAVLAPMVGAATDRYGARKVIMVGVVSFVLGAVSTGFTTQVWQIWITYGFFLGVTHVCIGVGILTSVTSWFRTRLGLGVGLMLASHGLGPALMAILIGLLLASVDWRTGFWTIGVAGGVLMGGLLVMFRSQPSDMGLKPYGAGPVGPARPPREPEVEKMQVEAYRRRMQGTPTFWKLVWAHLLGCVGHAIILIYIIPIAVAAGINEVSAAGVLSTLALVSALTRFLTPVAAERFGARDTMAAMFVLQGLPVLLLFWAGDVWQFYLFAVVFGIGYGGEGSGFPVINRQYFGAGPMGRSFGWQACGAMLGMALGGWSGGVLYGIFGNYDTTILLSVLTSVAGGLIILSMESSRRPIIAALGEIPAPDARAPSAD
ncbi:MAG: MFS transporter [Dehalococcoidia bacterium]|nr:MFS transporter [Dehalococcoidia bacterium]